MSRAKQKSLFLLVMAGVFILILAMSLPGLVLAPGQPFSLGQSTPDTPGDIGSSPNGEILMQIFQGILALALILLPFSILYSLFTAEGRRRLIRYAIVIVLLLLAANYLQNLTLDAKPAEQIQDALLGPGLDQMPESNPVTDFPDEPPQWLTIVVILIVSILIVAFMGGIFWFFQQRGKSPEFVLEKLAEEVQNAIVSIHQGGDFPMTIIHCYQEMGRVLKEEKGITREKFMTPREFEKRLMDKGFPRESIATLTRLFEQVRYSTIPTGIEEQNQALSCLADIVDACKAMGGRYERQ